MEENQEKLTIEEEITKGNELFGFTLQDNLHLQEFQICLMCYLMKLKGSSSRKISSTKLPYGLSPVPSHNTIAGWIRDGRKYFNGTLILFLLILEELREKENTDEQDIEEE